MLGMASEEQIQQLRALPIAQAETLFLQPINRHHLAGVEMAKIVNQFLRERGYKPITPENVDEIDLITDTIATSRSVS